VVTFEERSKDCSYCKVADGIHFCVLEQRECVRVGHCIADRGNLDRDADRDAIICLERKLEMAQAERHAVTRRMIELEQELGRLKGAAQWMGC
jgi:hypothetical protein